MELEAPRPSSAAAERTGSEEFTPNKERDTAVDESESYFSVSDFFTFVCEGVSNRSSFFFSPSDSLSDPVLTPMALNAHTTAGGIHVCKSDAKKSSMLNGTVSFDSFKPSTYGGAYSLQKMVPQTGTTVCRQNPSRSK